MRFVGSATLLLADESRPPWKIAMPKKVSARIQDHFVELSDPRRRKVTYPLINIVTIAICAVICGADDFVSIAEYGRKKRKWLAQFLDLRNGIPSHDRFNAILGAIKPAEFEACLLSWITALHEITAGQIVAIDGKTLHRQLRRRRQQVGHSYGQRLGHCEPDQLGASHRRPEEQRDHRHSPTAENPGIVGLSGDHRRDGLPDRDRAGDPRRQGGLRAGGEEQPANVARRTGLVLLLSRARSTTTAYRSAVTKPTKKDMAARKRDPTSCVTFPTIFPIATAGQSSRPSG